MTRLDRIISDQQIGHGQPTIRGTRHTVESLLELLASGMTNDEVLDDYPDLANDDILAALEFAALSVGGEQQALIIRDPSICHGQAVVKGTRIMVSVILECIAAGMTEQEIMNDYPSLTVEGIRAAAAHGAELARDEYPAVVPR